MNQIPKLIQKYRTNIHKTGLKLTKCLPLEEFPEGEVKEALVYAYKSEDLIERALASILNSAVSSNKTEFILSNALLMECFERDPNLTQKSISGKTMKAIVGSLVSAGFLEKVTEASNKPVVKRIASTYRLTDPDVLKLILGPFKAEPTKYMIPPGNYIITRDGFPIPD